jgi:hypothetical protein
LKVGLSEIIPNKNHLGCIEIQGFGIKCFSL